MLDFLSGLAWYWYAAIVGAVAFLLWYFAKD